MLHIHTMRKLGTPRRIDAAAGGSRLARSGTVRRLFLAAPPARVVVLLSQPVVHCGPTNIGGQRGCLLSG
eukprot:COSAG06_NODE_42866_length_377_cov_1.392086_1_plen_69_part_01